jgi:predicted DNA-binding protein (MmcQ/YjbR family)
MSAVFAKLAEHAMSLPGATQDIKWGADWVASVGGKMFLVGGRDPKSWKACSFKADAHRFLELTGIPGIRPAPYLARAGWVSLEDPKALPLTELKALVGRSHALVLAGLTKKAQKEILG